MFSIYCSMKGTYIYIIISYKESFIFILSAQMCLNQQCVSISELAFPSCSEGCNEHGVCNSRGHCHCDEGWGPPLCDSSGNGGSVDSGPVKISGRSETTLTIVDTFIWNYTHHCWHFHLKLHSPLLTLSSETALTIVDTFIWNYTHHCWHFHTITHKEFRWQNLS